LVADGREAGRLKPARMSARTPARPPTSLHTRSTASNATAWAGSAASQAWKAASSVAVRSSARSRASHAAASALISGDGARCVMSPALRPFGEEHRGLGDMLFNRALADAQPLGDFAVLHVVEPVHQENFTGAW